MKEKATHEIVGVGREDAYYDHARWLRKKRGFWKEDRNWDTDKKCDGSLSFPEPSYRGTRAGAFVCVNGGYYYFHQVKVRRL